MLAAVKNIDNAYTCDPARLRRGWKAVVVNSIFFFEYNESKLKVSTG